MKTRIKRIVPIVMLLFVLIFNASAVTKKYETVNGISDIPADTVKKNFKYINTNFENASQLDWSVDSTGVVNISLNYDHERSSPNKANGHWHFQVKTGNFWESSSEQYFTIILMKNIYTSK